MEGGKREESEGERKRRGEEREEKAGERKIQGSK